MKILAFFWDQAILRKSYFMSTGNTPPTHTHNGTLIKQQQNITYFLQKGKFNGKKFFLVICNLPCYVRQKVQFEDLCYSHSIAGTRPLYLGDKVQVDWGSFGVGLGTRSSSQSIRGNCGSFLEPLVTSICTHFLHPRRVFILTLPVTHKIKGLLFMHWESILSAMSAYCQSQAPLFITRGSHLCLLRQASPGPNLISVWEGVRLGLNHMDYGPEISRKGTNFESQYWPANFKAERCSVQMGKKHPGFQKPVMPAISGALPVIFTLKKVQNLQ